MAATKYTYSISTDFPNQKVNSDLLEQEIDESSISTALSYIFTEGDVCDIWFDDVLSGPDQTTLDGLVAAHQGTDTDNATQTAKAWGSSGTTDTNWQLKLELNSTPLKKGTYEVSWNAEIKMTTGGMGDHVEVHMSVDGTQQAETHDYEIDWHHFGGAIAFDFKEADTPEIKLKWRRVGAGGDNAKIRRAALTLKCVKGG